MHDDMICVIPARVNKAELSRYVKALGTCSCDWLLLRLPYIKLCKYKPNIVRNTKV